MSGLNPDAKEFVPRAASRPPSTTPASSASQAPPVSGSLNMRMHNQRCEAPLHETFENSPSGFRPVQPQHQNNLEPLSQPQGAEGRTPLRRQKLFSQTTSVDNRFTDLLGPRPILPPPNDYINELHDSNSDPQQQLSHIDLASLQQELKRIEEERKTLKDFESLIKLLVETPAEFESACEYIVYLISPHLKSPEFMRQLVTILLTVAWDVNFHYSAANLSKKLDLISPVFKKELFNAIDHELSREISNLMSLSLFVSELFYIFKPDMFPQFYRCLILLIRNSNLNENVKTACKLLKLNGLLLLKEHPNEYYLIIEDLLSQKSKFMPDTQNFIDRTLRMIETCALQAEAEAGKAPGSTGVVGEAGGAGDASNASSAASQQQQQHEALPQHPQQQPASNQNDSFVSFLTNAGDNDLVGALNVNHDSGVGGVFYGPDQRPLTQEELNFLRVSDDVSSTIEDYIQNEIQSALEDVMRPTDNVDYYAPN